MEKQRKNIYLRKDGRWEGRYLKEKKDGKRLYGSVFGKTYKEAEEKLDCAMSQYYSDSVTSFESFDSVSDEWLSVHKPGLKASSVAKYFNILQLYLLPKFGNREICSISRNEVMAFSRELLTVGGTKAIGLSPKTVNSSLSVMKNIFEYAKREKNLQVTDISDISVKQPQKPMRILSRPEQQRLSQYLCLDPSPCHIGMLLCLYTGLRIGEICALRWEDICFAEQYLYVHKTMQRIQLLGSMEKKTKVVIQTPKSDCSIRKIPIPEKVLQLLRSVQRNDDAFLLTGQEQIYIEPRNMENQFKVAASNCGIYDVNFHALRHTFATRCVELGFDIKSLSEILGHASVNITLNRYVHPSMELKQKNMNMLSCLLTTK